MPRRLATLLHSGLLRCPAFRRALCRCLALHGRRTPLCRCLSYWLLAFLHALCRSRTALLLPGLGIRFTALLHALRR